MKHKREVKIGIFAVLMILCLYFGINYLKGMDLFSSNRTYSTMLDNTGGLQTSASVLFRGVKIGSVTEIALDTEKNDHVVVKVSVKKDIAIPVDSHLKLFTNGFLGSKTFELVMGSSPSFFEDGAVIPSKSESDIFEAASTSLEEIIADLQKLILSLNTTSNSLNAILEGNSQNIEGTLADLRRVMGQLANGKIDNTLQNLNRFSGTLAGNSDKIGNIVANLDKASESLSKAEFDELVNNLASSMGRLDNILATVASGEGTAGHLINDNSLYDSLVSASANLSYLLEDLKKNPKRYINISVFGGGNKEKKNKQ